MAGLNLHGMVRGAITTVNPDKPITIQICTGYTEDSIGRQTPAYAPGVPAFGQVQDLTQRDIMHLASLNIQGSQKVVYVFGSLSGIVRSLGKGSDLITFDAGDVWMVTAVLEQWDDWCRVAVTMQNGA